MGKIKLSDTLRFVTARLNKIAGSELELRLEIDDAEVIAGQVIRARAMVRAPEGTEHQLTYVLINLRGMVQREGRWQEYVQRAETAHNIPLPGGHEYVIPIVIKIPGQAVLTEDGGNWRLRAQAVVDNTIDPRAECVVNVVGE